MPGLAELGTTGATPYVEPLPEPTHAAYDFFLYPDVTGAQSVNDAAIPEPASLVLMLMALAPMLLGIRRRR